MTKFDPFAEEPDEGEETASDRAMRAHFESLDRDSLATQRRGQREDDEQIRRDEVERLTGEKHTPTQVRQKEPFLKQYFVTVFVMEDIEVNPDATVANAKTQVWNKYGNANGRFRVTRADARKAMWKEPDEEEEAEFDQLRFVCDYVAKGANAADARVKITKILDETGVSHWGMQVRETASLRAAEPWAVPEDLPSLAELRRRAES